MSVSGSDPAHRLATEQSWDDLALAPETLERVREIYRDVTAGDTAHGYRAVFHGPPGTGKTLTATLIGQRLGRDVYRVDLSVVVSKYIGETEKNLRRLFARAEGAGWVLFFDEADDLFGKRSEVRDAHDRYSNEEVAIFLRCIESYDGLVILATSRRSNIDDAFVRRCQADISFARPPADED